MATILIIDDDPPFLEMLRRALVKEGHRVETADNGRAGLDQFVSHPCDLVITDILMPEQDGLETIRALRKVDPDLKIVAVSGGGRFFDPIFNMRLAKHLGADETLAKPFALKELVGVIQQLGMSAA